MGVVGIAIAVVVGLRRREPFLDDRPSGGPRIAGAALVSLLTGYAFATAIIGAAVVVDRVRYGGRASSRSCSEPSPRATAVGAVERSRSSAEARSGS